MTRASFRSFLHSAYMGEGGAQNFSKSQAMTIHLGWTARMNCVLRMYKHARKNKVGVRVQPRRFWLTSICVPCQ